MGIAESDFFRDLIIFQRCLDREAAWLFPYGYWTKLPKMIIPVDSLKMLLNGLC